MDIKTVTVILVYIHFVTSETFSETNKIDMQERDEFLLQFANETMELVIESDNMTVVSRDDKDWDTAFMYRCGKQLCDLRTSYCDRGIDKCEFCSYYCSYEKMKTNPNREEDCRKPKRCRLYLITEGNRIKKSKQEQEQRKLLSARNTTVVHEEIKSNHEENAKDGWMKKIPIAISASANIILVAIVFKQQASKRQNNTINGKRPSVDSSGDVEEGKGLISTKTTCTEEKSEDQETLSAPQQSANDSSENKKSPIHHSQATNEEQKFAMATNVSNNDYAKHLKREEDDDQPSQQTPDVMLAATDVMGSNSDIHNRGINIGVNREYSMEESIHTLTSEVSNEQR